MQEKIHVRLNKSDTQMKKTTHAGRTAVIRGRRNKWRYRQCCTLRNMSQQRADGHINHHTSSLPSSFPSVVSWWQLPVRRQPLFIPRQLIYCTVRSCTLVAGSSVHLFIVSFIRARRVQCSWEGQEITVCRWLSSNTSLSVILYSVVHKCHLNVLN